MSVEVSETSFEYHLSMSEAHELLVFLDVLGSLNGVKSALKHFNDPRAKLAYLSMKELRNALIKLGKNPDVTRNQALYLLPTSEVPIFMKKIAEVNKEFKELGEKIDAYYESLQNNIRLMKWLASQNMTLKQPNTSDLKVSFDLSPVSINTSTLRDALGDELGAALDEKTEQLLREYEQELQQKNKQLLLSIENELLVKLRSLLRDVASLLSGEKDKRKLRRVQQSLLDLERKAKGSGLEQLAQVVSVSAQAVKAILAKDKNETHHFANQLADLVKIPLAKSPDEIEATLAQAATKLAGVADARILALKRRMTS